MWVTKILDAGGQISMTPSGALAWAMKIVVSPGRPPCDWDDREAKEVLVDALVRDALAVLEVLDGEVLSGGVAEAADLLAVAAGQDVAQGSDGRFRIVRAVARDRVISTVDPQARHGHKSRSRRFDGYKGHVSADPDSESEIIDNVTVTPARHRRPGRCR